MGLLLFCLLAQRHRVTILDKRTESTRSHSLDISAETVNTIINYIRKEKILNIEFERLLQGWADNPINTTEIEEKLEEIVRELGVNIRRGVNVETLEGIEDERS